jgi:hypothetical protein
MYTTGRIINHKSICAKKRREKEFCGEEIGNIIIILMNETKE